MTVRENVALGREASFAGKNALSHVVALPRQARETNLAESNALDLCGLAGVADARVGVLSTGQRRMVELSRCLAGNFTVLLLDEPSSGLDRVETKRFGEILRRVVEERGSWHPPC